MIEKAIELGMEILLRVPNLSSVLQGEDTVNFKVNYTPPLAVLLLPLPMLPLQLLMLQLPLSMLPRPLLPLLLLMLPLPLR